MANYYESARTNYFRVKDEAAFRAFAERFDLEIREENGTFALFPSENSDGGFLLIDSETDEELDLADEIAKHLADDSIAVVMGSGHEKLRYVGGWAVAINSKGETATVNLNDIYAKAEAQFGIKPTLAEY